MTRREVIGGATLYLGDAREIVPTLPRPDAVISDPPYGQAYSAKSNGRPEGRRRIPRRNWGGVMHGDDAPFDPAWLIALTDNVLLWGAHKFWARLPPDRGRWLFWDKRFDQPVTSFGDGEAAWCSLPGPMRVFRYRWSGICCDRRAVVREDVIRVGMPRQHPTQKPVALMEWCLDLLRVKEGETVLDPYAGSGSTGVACIRRAVRFVGVEIVPAHFDTARRRIEAAVRAAEAREPAEAAA